MKKKLLYNSAVSVLTQIAVMLIGILLPRFFILNYGSDINGLLGTVSQIFTYVALMESGISAAAQNSLYKPIAENDKNKISEILSAANAYYHHVTIWYSAAILIIAFAAPFIIKSNAGYLAICGIIILEGASSTLNFWFIEKWRALLAADGKQYVESWINFFFKIATYSLKIILCVYGWNIILLSLGSLIISVIRLIIYKFYIHKKYSWIKIKIIDRPASLLEDRNAYVTNDVAWTVFSSTDMLLLSIMFSTVLASVYSVYNMIYSNLAALMNVFYSSVAYILGQLFYSDRNRYVSFHDSYETVFIALMSAVMSCCSVLTIPFVTLYTRKVIDINYIYAFLPIIMGEIQILSWDRYVSGNLVCVAGYAKQSMRYSLLEAVFNITFSIILGGYFGLYGITIATVLALIFKVVMLTRLANRVILKRNCIQTIRRIFVNMAAYLFISVYFIINPIVVSGYAEFFGYAAVVLAAIIMIYVFINFIFERKTVLFILNTVITARK